MISALRILASQRGKKVADIYQIHYETGLSVRALKGLERRGYLKLTSAKNPRLSKINVAMLKGNRLSAIDLVYLIENPDIVFDLGDRAERALTQIEKLNDPKADACEPYLAHTVELASKGDPAKIAELAAWMKSKIPASGDVDYGYLAVRILLGISPNLVSYIAGKIPRAFQNVRKTTGFKNWSSKKTNKYGQNATFFHRPTLQYDL